MKCTVCSKEVDETRNDIPPTWFGKYRNARPIEVICAECLKVPENRLTWRESPGPSEDKE
jgi:hypothetical protein